MRRITLPLVALALFLATGALIAVPATKPSANADKVNQLIAQLGSTNFRQREAATKELEAIGEAASEALKKASQSGDMEVASRAAAILDRINVRLENARRLAPTLVELKFKDTPVEAAVADLAKQCGFNIVIGGDKSKLTGRTVTLETGRIAFWTALEKLCIAADLKEGDNSLAANQPPADRLPPQLQPVPVQPVPIRIQIQPIQRILPAVPEKEEKPAEKPANPKPAEKPAEVKPVESKPAEKPQEKPVEAKPVPAQNAQPAQPAQPVPVRPAVRPVVRPLPAQVPPASAGPTIVLVDGKAEQVPTHVEGAIRVRPSLVPGVGGGAPNPNELGLLVNLRAEPRLTVERIIGVKVERAVDDQGQVLDAVIPEASNTALTPQEEKLRQLQLLNPQLQLDVASVSRPTTQPYGPGASLIRLKKGEKEAKSLRELSGVATVTLRTVEEELAVIEKPADAKANTAAKGTGDVALRLLSIKKLDNGDYEASIEVQYGADVRPTNTGVTPAQLRGQIQIQANGGVVNAVGISNPYGVVLLGEKDQPFQCVGRQATRISSRGNVRTVTMTATYRSTNKEAPEPTKLVFRGSRPVAVEVPFTLKDVVLK